MKNIAIIGSGSWGVALGIHLASIGNNVKIWSFMEEERDIINNEKNVNFYQMQFYQNIFIVLLILKK